MGIWHRVKASYREATADALRQANEAVPPSMRVDITDTGTLRKQDTVVPARPAAETRPATPAGRTDRTDRHPGAGP